VAKITKKHLAFQQGVFFYHIGISKIPIQHGWIKTTLDFFWKSRRLILSSGIIWI